MKWSLLELKKYQQEPLKLAETLDLKAVLQDRDPQIIDVSPLKISGFLTVDETAVTAYVKVQGKLVLPSTRSLKPTELALDFAFTEVYVPAGQQTSMEQDQKVTVIVLKNDTLDLDHAIVDNILLQIPMQVLTPHEKAGAAAMPKGDGWQVVSEDHYQQSLEAHKQQGDPRFAKLKGLFNESTDK